MPEKGGRGRHTTRLDPKVSWYQMGRRGSCVLIYYTCPASFGFNIQYYQVCNLVDAHVTQPQNLKNDQFMPQFLTPVAVACS